MNYRLKTEEQIKALNSKNAQLFKDFAFLVGMAESNATDAKNEGCQYSELVDYLGSTLENYSSSNSSDKVIDVFGVKKFIQANINKFQNPEDIKVILANWSW